MAFIPYRDPTEARGLLAELRDAYTGPDGVVDHILWIHGPNPRSLRDHANLYGHLMRGPSPLTRVQREMIAVTVSSENECFY